MYIRGIQLLRSHLKGEGGSLKIQTHTSLGKGAHDNARMQKWTGIVVKSRKRFTIFLFLLFYWFTNFGVGGRVSVKVR